MFPTLAPLAPSQHPQAMSFYNFSRCFGQVFGIAIGSTALTNALKDKLPASFLAQYGSAAETAIPYIAPLAEPLRTQVRVAYASSLVYVWYVSLGVAGLGLLGTLGLYSIEMTAEKDERWGLEGEGTVPVAVIGLEGVAVEKPGEGCVDATLDGPLAPPAPLGGTNRRSVRSSAELLSGISGRPYSTQNSIYQSPRPAPGAPVRMTVLCAPGQGEPSAEGRGRSTSVDWGTARI